MREYLGGRGVGVGVGNVGGYVSEVGEFVVDG